MGMMVNEMRVRRGREGIWVFFIDDARPSRVGQKQGKSGSKWAGRGWWGCAIGRISWSTSQPMEGA